MPELVKLFFSLVADKDVHLATRCLQRLAMVAGGTEKGLLWAADIRLTSRATCLSATRLENSLTSSVFRSVCSLASM